MARLRRNVTRLFTFSLIVLIAFWMAVASTSSVAICILTEFSAIVVSYTLLLSIGNCCSILVAYSTTLYPVSCRATATSLISMSGRLGGVFGAILISLILNTECKSLFYFYAVMLSSKHYTCWQSVDRIDLENFTVCQAYFSTSVRAVRENCPKLLFN